ncbi:MAG TPA: ribokinase [Mycolicibacillus parakoreensis]|nr:ribokinase [Mycolicibacillus parakoreensis]
MAASRVCVVGSLNLDTVLSVRRLPAPGETVLATAARHTPGGKGGNQAVAAARAGARVRFVGAVGDDAAGPLLRAHLRDHDVDVAALTTTAGPSGTAVVLVEATGQNAIVVAPGANERVVPTAAMGAAVADCTVLLMQLETPVATAVAAAEQARASGAAVILNASPLDGGSDGLAELADHVDVVVVNETEADRWRWPVAHRVVTAGAAGARYRGGGATLSVPAPRVTALDTAGAGDVFAGVLAAGWSRGAEPALRRACAAGALATLVPGAGGCAPSAAAVDRVLAGEDAAAVAGVRR